MENKSNDTSLTEGIRKLASMSVNTLKLTLENTSRNISEMGKMMSGLAGTASKKKSHGSKKDDDCGCCPPKHTCAPHCLEEIERHAYAGERIIVPFLVRNECQGQRTYRVGVRDLKSIDGSMAPKQPVLNKAQVTLEMGESELVLMGIDLQGFAAGSTYNAEIVLREKDINQNICFTLKVNDYNDVPVVEPLDENRYRLHWQSWQSHFYCEEKKAAQITVNTDFNRG